MDVPSPCQNICVLDDQQVCLGCRRSMEEIAYWASYDNDQKRIIIKRIAEEEAAEGD